MDQCRKCGTELTDENWYPSLKKIGDHICKACREGHTAKKRSERTRRVVRVTSRVAASRSPRQRPTAVAVSRTSVRQQAQEILAIAEDILSGAQADPIALRLIKVANARLAP